MNDLEQMFHDVSEDRKLVLGPCIVQGKRLPEHKPTLGKFNGVERGQCVRCGAWLEGPVKNV